MNDISDQIIQIMMSLQLLSVVCFRTKETLCCQIIWIIISVDHNIPLSLTHSRLRCCDC